MRTWTSRTDYTAVAFRGRVPTKLICTQQGVEIPPAPDAPPEEFNFVPYAIETEPAPIQEWPDPPHVEFVNCAFSSPDDVKHFVEHYGFGRKFTDPFHNGKRITVWLKKLRKNQDLLRQLWGKADKVYEMKSLDETYTLKNSNIAFVNGKPRIAVDDIWEYICALFLIDASSGRLKVCGNPDCHRLKYFVKTRRDQKFCSIECKNTLHFNTWLANPENRKIWNAARRKARLTRSGKRGK